MSERFSRLFTLSQNLYTEGSPAIISAGTLLKDNKNGKILVQLKICNISASVIKAAKICIQPLDIINTKLGDEICYTYLDLSIPRDVEFGHKTLIPLPNDECRGFEVRLTEVDFEDNSVWKGTDSIWESLPVPESIDTIGDAELVKQYRIQYGHNSSVCPIKSKDLWICTCGTINRIGESCHDCENTLDELNNVDLDSLRAQRDERLNKEKAERDEQLRIEAELKEKGIAAKRKRKKRTLIIASIALIVVAFVFVLVKIIIPSSNYNKAISLLNNGQYEEAIKVFGALNGYKDSGAKIQECKYNEASMFFESGSYEDAIAMFESLNDYKDSPEKIEESENAMDYEKAEVLLSSKEYDSAISIFDSLGNYKDSSTMVNECKYQQAMDYMAEKDYTNASVIFEQIPEYKDVPEYLDHLYLVPVCIERQSSTSNGEMMYYYFSYNEKGMMASAYREAYDEQNPTYTFNEDGTLNQEINNRSIYQYISDSDGTTTNYMEDIPHYKYDKYGNEIAFYTSYKKDDAEWNYLNNLSYDNYHNSTNYSENYYYDSKCGQGKILAGVDFHERNLYISSTFSYTCLYLQEENVDLDLIWKNIRMICGADVWYEH